MDVLPARHIGSSFTLYRNYREFTMALLARDEWRSS